MNILTINGSRKTNKRKTRIGNYAVLMMVVIFMSACGGGKGAGNSSSPTFAGSDQSVNEGATVQLAGTDNNSGMVTITGFKRTVHRLHYQI